MAAHANLNGSDVTFEDNHWIEDLDAEKLILELYDFRHGSMHTDDGAIEQPFMNVPKEIMHRLDGFFLSHT